MYKPIILAESVYKTDSSPEHRTLNPLVGVKFYPKTPNKALIRNDIGKVQRSILRADFVMPSLNKGYELLRKLSILVAFSLFVFSVVSPFYHVTFIGIERSDYTYWSYKAEHSAFTTLFFSRQSWFFDYWFDPFPYIAGPLTSWIPITVFIIQVLTLAFGCASIVVIRKIIVAAPVFLSLSVLALMSYAGYKLSSFNYGGGYQLGYYLVYPSVALFAFAFVLSEVTRKKQTTHTARA